jgi:hypothetical protein
LYGFDDHTALGWFIGKIQSVTTHYPQCAAAAAAAAAADKAFTGGDVARAAAAAADTTAEYALTEDAFT